VRVSLLRDPASGPAMRTIVLIVIAAGLMLRLMSVLWCPPERLIGDENYYWHHASAVLETGDPGDSFHPPGQPYLIALSRILFGHDRRSPRLLNVIAYLVAVLALLRLAGSWKRVLLPTCVLAFHPVLIGYSAFLWNETNFLALFFSAFAVQFGTRPSKKRMLVAGLLWGLAALVRKVALGFALLSLLAQWRWEPRHLPKGQIVSFLLGLIITLSPWAIRNYAYHGRLVTISTDTMFQLWAGNNDEVFRAYTIYKTPYGRLKDRYTTFGDTDRDREAAAYGKAIDFIRREQPEWFFRKIRMGLKRLFVRDNFVLRHLRNGSYGSPTAAKHRAMYALTMLGELAVIVLGIVMLIRAEAGPRKAAVVVILLYALAVHISTTAISRHRLVIELVPLLLAGVAWRGWTRRSLSICGMLIGVVLLSALL
jgi:hypothetical protein